MGDSLCRHAELDQENKVIGFSFLYNAEPAPNKIVTDDMNVVIGSIYHPETQNFSPPEPIPEPVQEPTIEEQILAENQYQTALLEVNTLGGNV